MVGGSACREGRHHTEIPLYRDVTVEQWNDWRWQMRHAITDLDRLEQVIRLSAEEREGYLATRKDLAMSITPYYAALMDPDDPFCPVRMQAVPTVQESVPMGLHDSLGEDTMLAAPHLVHRYPDRALLLVNNMCQLYCRHCTRKRLTGKANQVIPKPELEEAIAYLRAHPEIRDVLVSGGDPLMLSDANLDHVLSRLRSVPSLDIVRIGTRAPVSIPQRITPNLVRMLRNHHPLWMNTHFNHPKELTPEAVEACGRLVDAGIPLGNQTVLLRRVNSNARIMKELVHGLLRARVRPYYIYQCDMEAGLEHFRTSLETGLEIMESLRGWTTGFAVPTFVVDAPGGGGKIPVMPNYVLSLGEHEAKIRSFDDRVINYPQPRDRDESCPYEEKWAPVPLEEAKQVSPAPRRSARRLRLVADNVVPQAAPGSSAGE
jgi:lysine 2,3-aminomutase